MFYEVFLAPQSSFQRPIHPIIPRKCCKWNFIQSSVMV